MKHINIVVILWASLFCTVSADEMPYPTYDNSLIFGMVHYIELGPPYVLPDDINTILDQFGKGLYAPLLFSRFVTVDMNWKTNPGNANIALQRFKDYIDLIIQKARFYKVGIHFILTFGLSRSTQCYNPAKEEDIRNAQWYNDNNILREYQLKNSGQLMDNGFDLPNRFDDSTGNSASKTDTTDSIASGGIVNQYVFTTLSRYARKLRRHLETKTTVIFDYFKRKQRENPDVLMVISAPGEAELNYYGLDNTQSLPAYFCDYSPFAVMEFRDWITHEGMYAPGQKYAGQGYAAGGTRYQGINGLENFNNDFRTDFTTWDLKYYNWNLQDPVDDNYQDASNPDNHIIPVNEYRYGEMMVQTGDTFNGGFDPPRFLLPKGQNPFWDLWQIFRETMVYNYVKDMAFIAQKSGFPMKQYYTHQIPADYLEGTCPGNPDSYLTPRYYSSASPLWTARLEDSIGMGISLYDINYGDRFADTSQYVIPAISSMSNNWAVVESNPEVIPAGVSAQLSSAEYLYNKMMRLYDYHAHYINFFKWNGNDQYNFKDTNRDLAAKLFFDAIKDKARQSLNTIFVPKAVEGFTGSYRSNTHSIYLNWSPKIWVDLDYNWNEWGDFKEFIIYRGYSAEFQCNDTSRVAGLNSYAYEDTAFEPVEIIYYKLVAVNTNGEMSKPVTTIINLAHKAREPKLGISLNQLNFGASTNEGIIPSKTFNISNIGAGIMNWTAHTNNDWISLTPTSGINSGFVTVTVNGTGKVGGTYTGRIMVNAPGATNTPQMLSVTMVIYPSGTDEEPFGVLEFPAQDSVVYNTVAFTGWALDDIGVKSVKIYLLQEANQAFIGEAVLVEGARPDIMTAYPSYPNSHKAGWSYMMLTQNLPNHGNGIYTFKVIVTDGAGHEMPLGTRTIQCINDDAFLPFGALDTPLPGGIISGSCYRNQGWVLTPLPNMIPKDGSTLEVYVDGVCLGHPFYNIYRPDVAELLPSYANSNSAHAYFDIDTTTFKNGSHTIYWKVWDGAGNTSIIGDRKFFIFNPGVNEPDPKDRNQKPGKKQ